MHVILTTLHSKYIHTSLALPYLQAYCADLPCSFEIREFTTHEPKENILALLLEGTPDIIAFSVYLWNRGLTLELVDSLSVVRPEVRIILGGPEVSFEGPDLFSAHPGIDVLILGEGEIPFRSVLAAWSNDKSTQDIPRILSRENNEVHTGPDGPQLEDLDSIPSPFTSGRVNLERGFTYFETSRGCPYRCNFCMSSLEPRVRSFSMARIKDDLRFLMDNKVPKIKLVDRTFNYDPGRTRELFAYILEHNQGSHFHFEIGAHLLDDATIELLSKVPAGMFQFEIGVQSTLSETLDVIERNIDLARLEENVRKLRHAGNIHLHLDLIAGLPGESMPELLAAIDRLIILRPHHLQIEPVKLLPGAPLREQAQQHGLRFDPNPPYTVLETPDISFAELRDIHNLSRLLDMSWNQGRMHGFLDALSRAAGSFAAGLMGMAKALETQGHMRHPLSQRGLFEALVHALETEYAGTTQQLLTEHLARDFALSERVSPANPPFFFDTALTDEEQQAVRDRLAITLDDIRGQGIKLQHFSAVFHHLEPGRRDLRVFLYLTKTGTGLEIEEVLL